MRVVVIGGGAAGFFGAIACAEGHPHVQVTLLEASRNLLSKVRISGGGRCNVTHACFEPTALVQHYPRGNKALRGPFTRFSPTDTIDWFRQHGVKLKTEADGRMFPVTDDSATIVDCLQQTARAVGVDIWVNSSVADIQHRSDRFAITLRSGEVLKCDRILIATGSHPSGHKLAVSLGHSLVPPVPSLFTFNIPDPNLWELAGIAVETAQVTLQVPDHKPLVQTGPLLITHWGMSGPAVLKLSAWGARSLYDCRYRATILVNWLPDYSLNQVSEVLQDTKTNHGRKAVLAFSPFALPRRLWHYLVSRIGIVEDLRWAELSKASLQKLVQELCRSSYPIRGKGVFKEEFVTCGGIPLKEVDFKTMESRCCAGLFFAGEVLDIDGVTGGFNFQNAWTTAWLAGQAMAAMP